MPYPLNNVTTADAYTDGNTLQDQEPCIVLRLHVFNAAIYYSYQIRHPLDAKSPAFRQDIFLSPGFHEFPLAVCGVRVKSAVAGKPAQVTAVLIPADELPDWQ